MYSQIIMAMFWPLVIMVLLQGVCTALILLALEQLNRLDKDFISVKPFTQNKMR